MNEKATLEMAERIAEEAVSRMEMDRAAVVRDRKRLINGLAELINQARLDGYWLRTEKSQSQDYGLEPVYREKKLAELKPSDATPSQQQIMWVVSEQLRVLIQLIDRSLKENPPPDCLKSSDEHLEAVLALEAVLVLQATEARLEAATVKLAQLENTARAEGKSDEWAEEVHNVNVQLCFALDRAKKVLEQYEEH